jgi:hypothetical protein
MIPLPLGVARGDMLMIVAGLLCLLGGAGLIVAGILALIAKEDYGEYRRARKAEEKARRRRT